MQMVRRKARLHFPRRVVDETRVQHFFVICNVGYLKIHFVRLDRFLHLFPSGFENRPLPLYVQFWDG